MKHKRYRLAVTLLTFLAAVMVFGLVFLFFFGPPQSTSLEGIPVKKDAAKSSDASTWAMFQGNPELTGVASTSFPQNPELLWSVHLGSAVIGSPLIESNFVIVATEKDGVHALAKDSGKVVWQSIEDKNLSGGPCLRDNLIITGGEDGMVYALRLIDGTLFWKTAVGDGAMIKSSIIPVSQRLYFGSYDFNAYSLDFKTGNVQWRFETNERVHATPAISKGIVFTAGCDGWLQAIDVMAGKLRYSVDIGDYVRTAPVVEGGRIIVCTFSGGIFCLDEENGKIRWDSGERYADIPHDASPAISRGKCYIGGKDGRLIALDLDSGQELWSFQAKGEIESSPVIIDNRIIFAANDGFIRALDVKDGLLVWQFEAGGRIQSSPALAQRRLVVGNNSGDIFCFGKNSHP